MVFIILLFAILAGVYSAHADPPAPSGSTGFYRLLSNAEGSDVYFDSTYQGQITNGEIIVPVDPAATHFQTYTLRTPGGDELHGYLAETPLPGGTIILRADLTPQSVEKTGSLTIIADPSGATVYINGTFTGTIPTSGVLQFPRYLPGDYRIELRLGGYDTYSENFVVSDGAETTLNILLNHSTTGGIDFISFPRGARVFLDGTYIGTTPVHAGNISYGKHEARMTLDGYQEWDAQVLTTPDITIPVTARLFPLSIETDTPTPTQTKLDFPVVALFIALLAGALMVSRKNR